MLLHLFERFDTRETYKYLHDTFLCLTIQRPESYFPLPPQKNLISIFIIMKLFCSKKNPSVFATINCQMLTPSKHSMLLKWKFVSVHISSKTQNSAMPIFGRRVLPNGMNHTWTWSQLSYYFIVMFSFSQLLVNVEKNILIVDLMIC